MVAFFWSQLMGNQHVCAATEQKAGERSHFPDRSLLSLSVALQLRDLPASRCVIGWQQ